MKSHADKNQEGQSRSAAASTRNDQNRSSAAQFWDSRPKAIQMRKMQEMMNNSPRIQQLKAIQEMADNGPQAPKARRSPINSTTITQLSPIKKTWKQNRERFINPARRKPGVKKAKWLQLWESKKTLIEKSGLSIDQTLSLEKHLKKNGQGRMLDDYLNLAGIKGLNYEELTGMVSRAKSTSERGFPYPFSDKNQFDAFKINIRRLANVLKIRYSDIRVQGSALRKTDPHDLDIGIMVNRNELDRLKAIFDDRLVRSNIRGRGATQLNRAYQNGKFSPRDLAILGEEVTGTLVRVFELANNALVNAVGSKKAIPVQSSVILIGGSLDSKPYMSF